MACGVSWQFAGGNGCETRAKIESYANFTANVAHVGISASKQLWVPCYFRISDTRKKECHFAVNFFSRKMCLDKRLQRMRNWLLWLRSQRDLFRYYQALIARDRKGCLVSPSVCHASFINVMIWVSNLWRIVMSVTKDYSITLIVIVTVIVHQNDRRKYLINGK